MSFSTCLASILAVQILIIVCLGVFLNYSLKEMDKKRSNKKEYFPYPLNKCTDSSDYFE